MIEKKETIAFCAFLLSVLPWVVWFYIQIFGPIESLWVFPIPAPIATVLAFVAFNKKVKNPQRYGGDRYYVAAMVLGIIGTLCLIAIILNGGTETT